MDSTWNFDYHVGWGSKLIEPILKYEVKTMQTIDWNVTPIVTRYLLYSLNPDLKNGNPQHYVEINSLSDGNKTGHLADASSKSDKYTVSTAD